MQKSYMPNRNNSKTKITLGQYLVLIGCFFVTLTSLMMIFISAPTPGLAEFGFVLLLCSLAGMIWFNENVNIDNPE